MQIGEKYKFLMKENTEMIAVFEEIQTYPATGLPSDCLFKYVSGARNLVDVFATTETGKLSEYKDKFFVPEGIVNLLIASKQCVLLS